MIPAINASTWEEVVKKIRYIEPFTRWVHLDVADGTFTPNTLWHNPLDLVGFDTPLAVEVHLMEDCPEERVEAWLLRPVSRLIVHYEATRDLDFVVRKCRNDGVEVGLAINSHTSWTRLLPYAKQVDLLQILAVHAGISGQEFERHNLSKIKHLRASCSDCRIEVDGGVTPAVAGECVQAGANILASAGYVFNHPSPKMAIKELGGQ